MGNGNSSLSLLRCDDDATSLVGSVDMPSFPLGTSDETGKYLVDFFL